jgi:hypothetical protein
MDPFRFQYTRLFRGTKLIVSVDQTLCDRDFCSAPRVSGERCGLVHQAYLVALCDVSRRSYKKRSVDQ